MTASILQQLLALYFRIIYSRQLSSSEKSLEGEKIVYIFQAFYRFRFLLHRYFFYFLWQMLVILSVTQSARCNLSSQPFCLLGDTILLTNFENLNSVWNILHDFLVLTVPLIICIYLKTTNRHFRDQGNVRHPNSKLLKCDLIQTLNTSRNPSLRTFASGKASLGMFKNWGLSSNLFCSP